MALSGATPNAPAQLVELRETHALRILNDHQAGVRYIDANLDDGGCDEQLNKAVFECLHTALFFGGAHAAVNETDAQIREGLNKHLVAHLGGFEIQDFGLFDERTNPIRLLAQLTRISYASDNFFTPGVGKGHRGNRLPSRRHFIDDRGIEVGVRGHRKRTRDRCCRHNELVRIAVCSDAFLAQSDTLMNAEAMLLVNNNESEVLKFDALLKKSMCANDEAGTTVCN
jgi:hypothetical protein